ncbi:MAG: hypothetical protein ACP5U2_10055 [Bryobacteraceae bacterium]
MTRMKLTRRQVGWLLAAPGAAVGQAGARQQETADQLLAAARDRLRRNAEALKKVRLPQNTEPAFQFRAS